MTPLEEVYEMTDAPESEVDETLLLKVPQSTCERYPSLAAPACVIEKAPVEELYASGAEAEKEVRVATHEPLTARQPAVTLMPLFAVVVAPEVMRSDPPVSVRPFDAARPAALTDERVSVAVLVWRMVPPVTVTPLLEARPVAVTPPAKVEVAPLPRIVVVAVEPTS